jgi:hypothetical protein
MRTLSVLARPTGSPETNAPELGRFALEHFSVKWPRFTVKNAAEAEMHFSVKWIPVHRPKCGIDKVSC